LWAFGSRVGRYGSKRTEPGDKFGILLIHRDVYTSPILVRTVKYRRPRGAGRVAQMTKQEMHTESLYEASWKAAAWNTEKDMAG